MKRVSIWFIVVCLLAVVGNAEAQVPGRVKNKAKEVVEQAEETEDQQAEEEQTANEEKEASTEPVAPEAASQKNQEPATVKSYANYDFVPGDKIIFQYDMTGETDAEIPGRMAVNDGNVEVQTHNGEKVLLVPPGANLSMRPMMKNESYLPEQFTLEFEVMVSGANGEPSMIDMYFRAAEDAGRTWDAQCRYFIRLSNISGEKADVEFTITKPDGSTIGGPRPFAPEAVNQKQNNWRKVAVYVNKTIGKVYIDQHRLAVVNQIIPGTGMVNFEFYNDNVPVMLKNFRIAAGGADAYNKVVTDGKFIAYGILFDVSKANLKGESMGTINEVAKMMKAHPELKFEIGGHTDSDGSAATNNKLSQDRADAVKQQLITMGIAADRLTTKGYGSTKPIVDNGSAENKARNRRVEFVKK